MCLVLALTNTKNIKLSQCLNSIGNTLLSSQEDGFGYAVQGREGVFGEKTIAKKFRTRLGKLNPVSLPIVKTHYSSFGKPTELVGPGIFHGRSATNVISLQDTHPMQLEGWSLIHNGVVDDLGPKYKKSTENDSEDVLRRLLDGTTKLNPMEDIEKYLQGYYAFAAIDPEGLLHICRDDNATLFIAKSAKLDTYIIGTTEGLVLKTSKILDAKIGPIDEIESNGYFIFDGNNLIHSQDFNPLGFTVKQSAWSNTSLGRELLPTGGQIIDVSSSANKSEADWESVDGEDKWHDNITDFLRNSEAHRDRAVRHSSKVEDDYYRYKKEVDGMDASYQVYDENDNVMTLQDFKKLDHVHQELCTVVRADGSIVDPECYDIPRLRGNK